MATEITGLMEDLAQKARAAATILARAKTAQKNAALVSAADAIRSSTEVILTANADDLAAGKEKGLAPAMLDRLALDPARLEAIAAGLESIAALPDPVGTEMARWQRPNGLDIARIRTPLGVLGVIYESRPNVTADAGALCLKAGNAVILRGGSESMKSSAALHRCLLRGLSDAELPQAAISLVPITDRAAVGAMLTGLNGNIDVIVPRGGKSLVARVQAEARIPVIGHLDGICHLYADKEADFDKAEAVIFNAKMRRPGICGAAETLLIDQAIAPEFAPRIVAALSGAGCEVRGDAGVCDLAPGTVPATDEDWGTEYLAPILSVALVDGVNGAITHIGRWSSGHTESILTENTATAEKFIAAIDSAIVMHNASTQFADGGEFGMGAEIGIATSRIHARGPVGVEQLTTFKYAVRGDGQTRG